MTDNDFLDNYEEKDYSDRKILVFDEDLSRYENTLDVLRIILTGAKLVAVASLEQAQEEYLSALETETPYDTVVLDFRVPGVSDSGFVKKINNSSIVLVVLAFEQLILEEEDKSRAKLEPLRKLFDMEIKTTKARGS